jgi:hypothetical protein
MEFGQYVIIPLKDLAVAKKLVERERILPDKKFVIILTDEDKIIKKLPLALQFNNDEWSAWGFTLTKLGKHVASGVFGENEETGVDLESNSLDGDIGALAKMFGADKKKLDKILAGDFPDIEKFAKLLGFPILPITPYDIETKKKPKR